MSAADRFRVIQLPINVDLIRNYEFAILGRGAYDYTWIWGLGIVFCFFVAAGVRSSWRRDHILVSHVQD